MRAVFLDIDGVLCTPFSAKINRLLHKNDVNMLFDPVSLYWLQRLVKRTGAAVVLNSTWRDLFDGTDPVWQQMAQNLTAVLRKNGTPLFDMAPIVQGGDKSSDAAAWLAAHPCENYAVLDDNDFFRCCPEVRPHWVSIPQGRGLRQKEYRKAMRLLQS